MSTEISDKLATACATTAAVVAGVRDDQLEQPTPCADYQVRDLLNHLMQVVVNFQAMARRADVDWTPGPDRVVGDWRADFAAETRALVTAWSDPDALEGVSPGMGLPQPVIGNMVLVDLVVHGWDLARATGQPYTVDESLVGSLRAFFDAMIETGRKMGAFGAAVPCPPGADGFAELLAISGRNPAWSAA